MKKKKTSEIERLSVEEYQIQSKKPIVIVLDNIRSMQNVGSFFRTADAFGIEQIFLCGFTPSPPHRDIHKTALGATETVKWEKYSDIFTCLRTLKKDEYKILAVEQTHDSIPLKKNAVGKKNKYALVFGNEVDGVSQEALDLCDSAIEIEQYGTKHSLNVAVCGGIVMHYFAEFMM